MNAKVLIVALCAFQLAAGGIFTDTFSQMANLATNAITSLSQKAIELEQKAKEDAQNARASALSELQDWKSSIQQYISAQISSAQEAAPKVQACLKNLTDTYAAIYNSTQNELQAQSQSERASIQPYVDQLNGDITAAKNVSKYYMDKVGSGILAPARAALWAPEAIKNATDVVKQTTNAVLEASRAEITIGIKSATQIAAIAQASRQKYNEAYNGAVQCLKEATSEASTTAEAEPDSTTLAATSA